MGDTFRDFTVVAVQTTAVDPDREFPVPFADLKPATVAFQNGRR